MTGRPVNKTKPKVTKRKSSAKLVVKKPVHLTKPVLKAPPSLTCCCSQKLVNLDLACSFNSIVLENLASAIILDMNDQKGYVPSYVTTNPGILTFYLWDCVNWYANRLGTLTYVPGFNAGALVVPAWVGTWMTENCAHVLNKADSTGKSFFRRRQTSNTLSAITSLVTNSSGAFGTDVITNDPYISGEPVLGAGATNVTLVTARPYYSDVIKKFAGYGPLISVDELGEYTSSIDYFLGAGNTMLRTNIAVTRTSNILLTSQERLWGSNLRTGGVIGAPDTDQACLMIIPYFLREFQYKAKRTLRSAIAKAGYDPLEFTITCYEACMSKFRGLIFSIADQVQSDWSVATQDNFIAFLINCTSYFYVGMPLIATTGARRYKNVAFRNYPVLAVLSELGVLARKVNNSLFVPYINLQSTSSVLIPTNTPLLALIQPSFPMSSSFDESAEAFPVDFNWSSSLSAGGIPIPGYTSKINYIPLNLFSELQTFDLARGSGLVNPMVERKPVLPMTVSYAPGINVTSRGGPVIYLPAPAEITCLTYCDYKECAVAAGLCLFTFAGVAGYVMDALDISGEVYDKIIRSGVITQANIVAAGSMGNDPQKSITKMFYNNLVGRTPMATSRLTSREFLTLVDNYRSEGNAINYNVTEESWLAMLTHPTSLSALVSAAAGLISLYPRAREFIASRREVDALLPSRHFNGIV